MSLPFTSDGGAVRLTVRVTPRASRSEIGGIVDAGDGRTALAVRLRAPPVEGAANRALAELLAAKLGLPRRAVTIAAGETSRLKIVRLEGADPAVVERLCAQ